VQAQRERESVVVADGVAVQRAAAAVATVAPAFIPVVPSTTVSAPAASPPLAVDLHVRLPNGVELELGEANLQQLATIVQMLGKLPCSASTPR
jgi:transposase